MTKPTYILDFMPTQPGEQLRWNDMTAAYPWIAEMIGSTQDPIHHGEGDVWIHTKMVVEALLALPEWSGLDRHSQEVLFIAAVMHDIAKPETREIVNGRIGNPHHSRRGAAQARAILWNMDVDAAVREQVCAIIKVHQVPFWLLTQKDWQIRRRLIHTSLAVINYLVYLHAKADILGRISPNQQSTLTNVELFSVAADDLGCLREPFKFGNDHTKMAYFEAPAEKFPAVELYDVTDKNFTITMTSGLPGSGKSTWLSKATSAGGVLAGQPIVSLDRIREEMDVAPTENQGRVRQQFLEHARVHLREKRSFVVEGTNLFPDRRGPILSLAMDYGARTRIVAFETPKDQLLVQNRARPNFVPEEVIMRMVSRWDPPHPAESHELWASDRPPMKAVDQPGYGFEYSK